MTKKYRYCDKKKLYLPQKDWMLHCRTEWKWSLIGHCTIWGHPGSCLHLSHWHPALRGLVQGGLGRGAGLHQPRQHTGEKANNKGTVRQESCLVRMQIRCWICCANFENNGRIKIWTWVRRLLKACCWILNKGKSHICITYKHLTNSSPNFSNYWQIKL